MCLKDNMLLMQELMHAMVRDLEKTAKGNRAAAQRVRIATVHFARVAKEFRKESMAIRGKKSIDY